MHIFQAASGQRQLLGGHRGWRTSRQAELERQMLAGRLSQTFGTYQLCVLTSLSIRWLICKMEILIPTSVKIWEAGIA